MDDWNERILAAFDRETQRKNFLRQQRLYNERKKKRQRDRLCYEIGDAIIRACPDLIDRPNYLSIVSRIASETREALLPQHE